MAGTAACGGHLPRDQSRAAKGSAGGANGDQPAQSSMAWIYLILSVLLPERRRSVSL